MMKKVVAPPSPRWFRQRILSWYDQHGRQDLPWKTPITPYGVWVSEIMLQQTQVSTVIDYYQKFMRRFPDVSKLARAKQDTVLSYWAGLGYYARARNLHSTAKIIHQEYNAQFPQSLAELMALPGIGRSTAGAILAQAFDKKATILDGNVKRVLARVLCLDAPKNDKQHIDDLWAWSERWTPTKRVADYTQAMMDLGATLCTRSRPRCPDCPVIQKCAAKQNHREHEIPRRSKKSARPTKQITFLGVICQNKILLQKRPNTGIWGGLYSLPEYTDDKTIEQWLGDNFNPDALLTKTQVKRHSFTHYHLDYQTYFVCCNHEPEIKENESWFSLDKLGKVGLPAPIKKELLAYAQQL
mgnify:CR=1 FL=1|tara:strand:+ start:25336 stop:26400 length:1065 start_codon:yes stop_codon:yes gene_type:complete